MSLDDDDENGAGSADSESDNDVDETMEDVDGDMEGDAEGDGDGDNDADADGDNDDDGDGDNDNDDDEGDNDDDDDQDEVDSPSQQPRSLPNGASSTSQPSAGDSISQPMVTFTSPSPRPPSSGSVHPIPERPSIVPEALTTSFYDIVPTIAAPHSTSINAVTALPNLRWVFTGGSDGYIRKFNWIDTVNGKLMLTVAQRHPFVETVVKAGVTVSYWENYEPSQQALTTPGANDASTLSPVYSLAAHNQALWLLSGLESGGINVQTVRHNEGTVIHTLRGHGSAVSVLTLSQDERSVLSGSWDKTIIDWDLNTGKEKRKFASSGGQISAIEMRPHSSLPVPQDSQPLNLSNGTYSSNNASRPGTNVFTNGADSSDRNGILKEENRGEDGHHSPGGSLFGDNDSLFGDKDDGPSGSGVPNLVDDDDDEFSRAIANDMQQQNDEEGKDDVDMADSGGPVQAPQPIPDSVGRSQADSNANGSAASSATIQATPLSNGLPHSEEAQSQVGSSTNPMGQTDTPLTSDSVFLDSSHDGTLRVWDRRQPNPIARIAPPRSVPPWCMSACWSPDGNSIYAGRRNGTVDEYSLHKGLRDPKQSLKLPHIGGAVSAVKAMPNGRHLICASYDILRIYDLNESVASRRATPYSVVPGHRTGVISAIYLDPTSRFMISTGGNRGWEGSSTEVMLGYEIGF